MKEEILPETKNEGINENPFEESTIDNKPEVVTTSKKTDNNDAEKIAHIQKALDKKYENLQQQIAEKGKPQSHGIPFPIAKSETSWWRRIGAMLGVTGAMITGAKATPVPTEDTLAKKEVKEKSIETKKSSIPKNTASFIEGTKEKLPTRPVTPQERKDWNAFLAFVKEKGYQGSKELDKGSDKLARSLFTEYKKLHPETTIEYSIVALVQDDMQKLKENVQAFARRRKDPTAEQLMNNVSEVDGWFGSKTSQYGYPEMFLTEYHNDVVVKSTGLGTVDANMNSEKKITTPSKKKIPPNVKIEHLQDGDFYEDPETGDLVRVN